VQIVVALDLPFTTSAGTKYHPTVKVAKGCNGCPYRVTCRRDVVERDGLAWCEDVIPADLDPSLDTDPRSRQGGT